MYAICCKGLVKKDEGLITIWQRKDIKNIGRRITSEIETSIESVETRLYNIKQEKISGENMYQFLLFFDK